MVIKICGEHGYREQGDNLEDLECPGCQEKEDEENREGENMEGERP